MIPTYNSLLLFLLCISLKSFTQNLALKYDKDVVAIAKAMAVNKPLDKWKTKPYYATLEYMNKMYGSFGYNATLLDLKMLKKPNDNVLVVATLLFHLEMMQFQNSGKDQDSLCKQKLKEITPEEGLFRYYEHVFGYIFSTQVPEHENLSKINFDLEALDLKTNKEKMIFYIAAANRLNAGIEIYDISETKLQQNINYVDRCPTFDKQKLFDFPLLKYEDFKYNGSTFSYKIEQYNYIRDKYTQTYEAPAAR